MSIDIKEIKKPREEIRMFINTGDLFLVNSNGVTSWCVLSQIGIAINKLISLEAGHFNRFTENTIEKIHTEKYTLSDIEKILGVTILKYVPKKDVKINIEVEVD